MPLIELCNIANIRKATGLSKSTLNSRIASGILKPLPGFKKTKVRRFEVDHVNQLIREGKL